MYQPFTCENFMNFPLIDLHCDLLSFLEISDKRTPYDSVVHCSVPQLRIGGVKLQVMAVFTRTRSDSVACGNRQIEIYKKLPIEFFTDFVFYKTGEQLQNSSKINISLAIENASGLWGEDESFDVGLRRFESLLQSEAKPLYIGFTWHQENRFGGGNASKIGLKEDGKHLLGEMHDLGIAVDLSHTSDALADGILDYLEYKNLKVPILASHSNARTIKHHVRNLPDAIAKEIFKRGGVIGLNFYKEFVGDQPEGFIEHIGHWLELGGEKHICFGADFFYEGDGDNPLKKIERPYFTDFQDAGSYPRLLDLLKKELRLDKEQLGNLSYRNAESFISNLRQPVK